LQLQFLIHLLPLSSGFHFYTHAFRSLHGIFMHYPECTTLPVRTRKCGLLQRYFRDVTLTPARITDITLSQMALGKCRLPLRHFRDVTWVKLEFCKVWIFVTSVSPTRITDITLSRMTLGKCCLLQRDVTLPPTRITDITLWRKCLVPAAMLCPGFCTRFMWRRSKR